MSINANRLVNITPRVISGGSADLETNGLILTANALISADSPAMEVKSAQETGLFFGYESAEYNAAVQYFSGVTNQRKSIKTLYFGRDLTAAGSGWIRGGKAPTLASLQAVTNGGFDVEISGTVQNVSGLDLSGASSFSDVATLITAGLTGATVTYNSNLKVFVITVTATGATSTIGYGSAPSSGTDLSDLLGLTEAGGAVLSQGNAALTIAENMDKITTVTRNFVGFTTLTEATDDNAKAYAAWADLDDDYSKVRNRIKQLYPDKDFHYMLNYLNLEHYTYNSSSSDIVDSFVNSPTLQAIRTPVIQDQDGSVEIDKNGRFFMDDIYYGIAIVKWMAELLLIDVPMIDKLLHWAQELRGEHIISEDNHLLLNSLDLVAPMKSGVPCVYGKKTINDIVD